MKLDIKTLFVALSICISYSYINSHKDNEIVNTWFEPSVKVVSLSY